MAVNLPVSAAFFPKNIKVWGATQSILLTEDVHVAFAKIQKGGYSSIHSHVKCWNRFFVVEGKLEITAYRNKDRIEQEENIILNSGECLDVEPGLYHKMAALEDCSIIEIYWTEDSSIIRPDDIIRINSGGKKSKEEGAASSNKGDYPERTVRCFEEED